ncbi:hypothetical protein F3K39_19215 [Streptomyces sp. LBUM 1479]|uniref:phage tail tape measure protein n=1 Tax=Streptomyces scabiei TaxID=1930 RepID=UPI001B314B78|nr:phage tail tape measure protein [Streptomyces sp. LBUM 1475]MBP5930197.1 hypothetical protein [Streptomyces sp. LBUM 1479]QTU63118.1 hypothetical protein F3K22_20735 [Streptomyces sp. LBUM 1475]
MALVVGELTGVITLDDTGVDPALRRAERAMRDSGEQMGDDAERAGRQAGENLGEGFVRGADGRLRDVNGRFVRAVRQAGDDATTAARSEGENTGEAFGDGLSEGAEQGGDNASAAAVNGLEKLKTAAAGVGLAAGAALMAAMGQAMEQSRITGRLGAQLGATPAEAQKYGKIAGALYSKAITEDFQSAADAISVTMRAGLLPPDATNAQIESIATKVSDLATTFELDLGQAANAVGQILKTGLARDGGEALDVLTRGLQVMGPRADDIADTFNEYSTIFRQLGISAEDATGIMSQGLKAGARDTDVVADSLKELVLITQGGGDEVDAAFAKIKLSGKEMQAAFTEGGPAAEAALDKIFDGLRKVKDPADRSALALTLFGTKSEDMQKALFAIDPSKAVESLGQVGGEADRMGDTLRDNAGTKLEAFKRGMQQNLVDFLGGAVIPGLETFRGKVGGVFGRLWEDAGKGSEGTADRIISFFGLLGQKVAQKAVEQAPKAVEGLMNFGGKIADFVAANPEKVLKIGLIAAAITLAIVALPITVGAALSVAVGVIIAGFVRNLVTGLTNNLPKWWQAFTSWVSAKAGEAGSMFSGVGIAIGAWFGSLWSRYIGGPVSRAWSSFITSVRALPGRTLAALAALGGILATTSSTAWQRFKDGASRKGTEFLSWVRGLPGRAKSALGNVGSILLAAGGSLIQGFINGIKAKIGSVRSAASSVVSAARDYFPFSPARKGPFSGRGYSTYSGQALMSDFAKSIRSNTGQVGRALAGMPGMPDAMADSSLGALAATPTPGQMTGAYAASAGAGSASESKLVRVDLGGQLGDAIVGVLRDKIGAGAGGDVQLYLGTRR